MVAGSNPAVPTIFLKGPEKCHKTLSVLEAVIGLIRTLGDEGLVGLLAGIWLVGQFFLSYKLYGSLKNKYESL